MMDANLLKEIQSHLGKKPLKENLRHLFCETLRWGSVKAQPFPLSVGSPINQTLMAHPIAQLSGMPVFRIDWGKDRLPTMIERRTIHRSLAKNHLEHLICYVNKDGDQASFVWARKRGEKKVELRTLPYEIGSPARTTIERLGELAFSFDELGLYGEPSVSLILQKLSHAFDVEAVTKQFFDGYKRIFADLQKRLSAICKDIAWAHDYALQLLNRMMFLYFIQKKRWLGGDPEFIRTFWSAYKNSNQPKDSFFEKWLSVLFFEAFNRKFQAGRSDRRHFPPEITAALSSAPFLNGGLFTQNESDEKFEKYGVKISDEFFEALFDRFNGSTPGFLERYNFTITESTPFDIEVAVDPEMIGKVYESLVNITFEGLTEEDLRGTAGIFYTPRVEIDLMCCLSLVDWLTNNLGEDQKPLIYNAVLAYEPQEKEQADREITQKNLWPNLNRLFQEITVCDPACGSGSFLIGMLLILDDLQARAGRELGIEETPYERRRRIIGQNLYGVDVMDWAVHVAELRLWLQLVIETELEPAELQFRPLLPNLSFKIRQGDSLVQEVGGINFGLHRTHLDLPIYLKGKLTQLKGKKLHFFQGETHGLSERLLKKEEVNLFREILQHKIHYLKEEVKKINRQIESPPEQYILKGIGKRESKQLDLLMESLKRDREEKESELSRIEQAFEAIKTTTDLPFVWDISFVEIFEGEKGGFDIVLGNPPYVRQEKIEDPQGVNPKKTYKEKLQTSVSTAYPDFFKGRRLDGKSDLYVYFYLHGLSLLNEKGSFCFITSNSWLDVGYGAELQEFLLRHSQAKMILDNEARRSFAQADVNTIIALLAPPNDKKELGITKTARFVMFKVSFEDILSPVIFQEIEEASERFSRPEFHVCVLNQKNLLEEGTEIPEDKNGKPLLSKAKYSGNKWGGKYLRAPEIFFKIMKKICDCGRPLGEFVWGQRYLNTGGADGFFIFTNFKIIEKGDYIEVTNDSKEGREYGSPTFLIEKEFLRPAIKSTDIGTLVVSESDALVLDIPPGTQHLRSKEVFKYIKWGEKVGFNRRSVTSIQTPWWKSPRQARESGPILLMRNYNDVHKTFYNPKRLIAIRFYRLYPYNPDHEKPLIALLNTTIFALFREIYGSTKLGLGALDATMADMLRVPIPFPLHSNYREELTKNFDILSMRSPENVEIERLLPDRRALDEVIFDALELTAGEREAVYEAVVNLVRTRLSKARSLGS